MLNIKRIRNQFSNFIQKCKQKQMRQMDRDVKQSKVQITSAVEEP